MVFKVLIQQSNTSAADNTEEKKKYKCCLCCHVLTGTLCLGLWHLVFQLVALCFVGIAMFKPELLQQWQQEVGVAKEPLWWSQQRNQTASSSDVVGASQWVELQGVGRSVEPQQPTTPSAGDILSNYRSYMTATRFTYTSQELRGEVLILAGTTCISLLLVYGLLRRRPTYLLPFLCLQALDLILTLCTLLGYLTYMPNVRDYLRNNMGSSEERSYLDGMSNECLLMVALLVAAIIVAIKAYLIDMVWSCYKYLSNYQAARRARAHDLHCSQLDAADQQLMLPPKYEEIVVESCEKQQQPPPYTAMKTA